MLRLDKKNPKILIIKPSAFGDIIHSLPVLAAIKKRFPHASVHWVVAEGLHRFLAGHPLIDRLWIFRKEAWKRPGAATLSEVFSFVAGLRRERFDVSIDLSGLLRSGVITGLAGARYKIGFKESDEGSPFFYNHKISVDMETHAIERYLQTARYIGCPVDKVEYPMAPVNGKTRLEEEGLLPPEYCVMAPSAGKEANRWPAERFGRLAARLPLPSVMIGGPGDAAVVAEAVRHARGKGVDAAGKTSLMDLVALLDKACFLVTNDTGPMHLAAARNTPVFAIFGPANPARTGPYGAIHTVIRRDLDCSPCYRWKPCSHWRCMEEIGVEEVFAAISAGMFGGPA